ncbi:MAG: FTR1 family iron permease, partial [Arsenophonus sp. ET-YP4-MAG3]
IISILLAFLIYGIFNILNDTKQSLFMIFMEVFACILIVQMVYWMNKYNDLIKFKIKSKIKRNIDQHNWFGITLITIFAIAREGSEIVVFISSFIMSLTLNNTLEFFIEVIGGIFIASLTLYIFLLTNHFISWSVFFKITSVILLFFALSLLLKGVEEGVNLLIEFDYFIPEFLIYPVWNTSELLDDSKLIGNFISSFFAYRSQPILLSVIIFVFYWFVVIILFSWSKKRA